MILGKHFKANLCSFGRNNHVVLCIYTMKHIHDFLPMKWLHNLLKGFSLTTALFIFQACYGTPDGLIDQQRFFKVVEAGTGEPLDSIWIKYRVGPGDQQWQLGGRTGELGEAVVWIRDSEYDNPEFRFESDDPSIVAKDTLIVDRTPRIIEIPLVRTK